MEICRYPCLANIRRRGRKKVILFLKKIFAGIFRFFIFIRYI